MAKARLCAKGFLQVQGVDYGETYAPVVKFTSIRVILALVAYFDLELHQMDVVTAFLNGDIDADVYMEIPEGCDEHDRNKFVCKLKEGLYGTKQGPRCWNHKINPFLIEELGFRASDADPCVYVKEADGFIVIIAIYVDDLLIAGNNTDAIKWLKSQLRSRFDMKDLGDARKCPGLEITRDRARKRLNLSQSAYCDGILERFGMEDCRAVATPMEEQRDLNRLEVISPSDKPVPDDVPYREAMG